ncbi:MAG: ketopantoate reductase family protein [Microbacteriaceae bacterium]|uniref:ketopantoate reductase family protein n=1 Tax=Microbacterium sp. JB110 TaxID=2024477 RepID=UPI00097EBD1D|nr:2-dehydropantoate 2-reductase [Microbacterium sp. JB110]SJM55327.1 2-dehydropantoate 2-reductase [Frigoribacterium sp. JB110]
MSTVAVVGSGAIGMVLADAAARAGCTVVLCGARAVEQLTVIGPDGVRTTTVAVCRDPRDAVSVDIVLLAVKRQDSYALDEWSGLIAPDTLVVRAQNGVDPAPTGGAYGQVVPSVVRFGATRVAAGIVLRASSDLLVVPPEGASLADHLSADSVRVEVAEDFRVEQWRKFAMNICAGGLTTLFDRGLEIFTDPFVQVIARALLDEVRAVAAADGVRLEASIAEHTITDLAGRPYGTTTSMLRDARAGNPLELDAHGAELVRIAEWHDIHAPVNARLVDALAASVRYEERVR